MKDMEDTKKQSLCLLGILVVLFSGISELVISMTKEEQWNNYVHSWNTKWKDQRKATVKKAPLMKKPVEPHISVCRSDCEY
jgi:hypothetical protein